MVSKIKLYQYLVNMMKQLEQRNKNEEMYLTYLEWKLDKLKKKKEGFVVQVQYDIDLGDLNY